MCNWNLARVRQWTGSQPERVEEGDRGDAIQVEMWTAWTMTPRFTSGSMMSIQEGDGPGCSSKFKIPKVPSVNRVLKV